MPLYVLELKFGDGWGMCGKGNVKVHFGKRNWVYEGTTYSGNPREEPNFWGKFIHFGHVNFDIPIRHISREVKWTIGYIHLEFRRAR